MVGCQDSPGPVPFSPSRSAPFPNVVAHRGNPSAAPTLAQSVWHRRKRVSERLARGDRSPGRLVVVGVRDHGGPPLQSFVGVALRGLLIQHNGRSRVMRIRVLRHAPVVRPAAATINLTLPPKLPSAQAAVPLHRGENWSSAPVDDDGGHPFPNRLGRDGTNLEIRGMIPVSLSISTGGCRGHPCPR